MSIFRIFRIFSLPPHLYLAKLKANHDITGIVDVLKYNEDWQVRREAISVLAELDQDRAYPLLIEILKDSKSDIFLRRAAAKVLGKIGEPKGVIHLIMATQSNDSALARVAYESIMAMGSRALNPLVDIVADKTTQLMKPVLQMLEELIERDCTSILLKAVMTERGARSTVMLDLFLWQKEKTITDLLALLKDKDEQLRASAVSALGKICDAEVVKDIIVTLEDESENVRQSAANALGDLRDLRALEPLLVALRDKSERVCFSAASALGKLKDERAIKPLIIASEKVGTEMRLIAADALGDIAHPLAVNHLIKMLHEEFSLWRFEYPHDIKGLEPLIEPKSIGAIINALRRAGTQKALDAIRNYSKK
jgi:HEAT repeat protein